jgi:tellurite resistance protein TerC
MGNPALFWIGFHGLILLLLGIDLGVLGQKEKKLSFKKACFHSCFWIFFALIFNLFVYFQFGSEKGLEFFTGYLIEKSLSVDNLFLFLIIFSQFRISEMGQRKVLFWGILGAIVLRLSLILAGISLIEHFHWMFYVFGGILLASGVNIFFKQKPEAISDNCFVRVFKKFFPVIENEGEERFFVRHRGKWKATMLFVTLLMVESTDIVVALDSVPAVFAVTTDPFIVYTSNVFAILGLRSLHFVFSASLKKWRYIQQGLALILAFVGIKMLTAKWILISIPVSLGVIGVILAATIVASSFRRTA